MNFDSKQLGNGIDLMAGRYRADDRARPAAILFQMIERQRQHLVGSQPGAILIDNAEPIGVAVQSKPELRAATANKAADFRHSFGIRLGMMSAEERIQF